MGSNGTTQKPHVVCIPYPAQGHINPMFNLAKLLHHKGFHITFVHTEYNYQRLLKSRGPNSLDGLTSFRFETIPDGLPPSGADVTQDIPALCVSTKRTGLSSFRNLLSKLNNSTSLDVPPVTCIVSDGAMSFTLEAAEEIGVPEVLFWTTSACGFLGYSQYHKLVEKGLIPLKDSADLTNGYLNTVIDWIPGMTGIRLKDLPSFLRTTDPNDILINFVIEEAERAKKASALIFNTYDALESDVLNTILSSFPPVYTIGPLHLLNHLVPDNGWTTMGSNLWREDKACLNWLDSKQPCSVVYVNFGSITVMTADQLNEFAWGLANSNKAFLWIIRPDLVTGDSAVLPPEFASETRERGFLTSWCPQEQVLNHPSVGGFLTHSGWNSTIESLSSGVPMICWPFFAEQQTNCRYCCDNWDVGMEIDSDVKRDEVEKQVKELMDGEKGKEMKKKAMEWKGLAQEATTSPHGSSYLNLENLIQQVLLQK